jgi:choline dehydrogenase-like flavoprotein
MLRDLSKIEPGQHFVRADVVVIGAGLAGLILSTRLSRLGLRVAVLESGGLVQRDEEHPLNEVVSTDQIYRGAEVGRFRCLGGTSTRWGGAMLPFQASDMGPRTAGSCIEWPVSIEELAEAFDDLEHLFDLPAGEFELVRNEAAGAQSPDFILRSAKWPVIRKRNVANVVRRDIANAGHEVWLNATAAEFRLDEAGRLKGVKALSPSGSELVVEASYFALAAGAIESTRLLLMLDAQHGNRIFAPDAVIGRYFYDHLSAPAATILPVDRSALLATFGLRFASGGMRDCRLEPTASLRTRLAVPGGFAHVGVISPGANGFTALRAIYRAIQRNSMPQVSDIGLLARNLGWFAAAAWWRCVKHTLLAPRDAQFELTLVIEQMPDVNNRIVLSSDRCDGNGSPLAQIEWRVRERDLETFRALQAALLRYWTTSSFGRLGKLAPTPFDDWRERLNGGADICHPGGSTRMATSPASGVVDMQLRTFRIPNLYVISTSTFPSGGSANPSFTLMAFALRAAGHIAAGSHGRTTAT